MSRAEIVRAYARTLRELRSHRDHFEWCDNPDCYPQDRRERLALGELADALKRAYRVIVLRETFR